MRPKLQRGWAQERRQITRVLGSRDLRVWGVGIQGFGALGGLAVWGFGVWGFRGFGVLGFRDLRRGLGI